MISGAFGPVPWDVAPLQLAKDGEDYAYRMLGQIALDPEGVWTDCAATISCARSRVRSTSA
eukprot:8984546-Pyramimonas_sp.AAC.1